MLKAFFNRLGNPSLVLAVVVIAIGTMWLVNRSQRLRDIIGPPA